MSAVKAGEKPHALDWRHIDQAKATIEASSAEQFVDLVVHALIEAVSKDHVEEIVQGLKDYDVPEFEAWADSFHMASQ